jgi:hypothetical protein
MRLTITEEAPDDLPSVESLVAIIREHPDRRQADRALTAAYRGIDSLTGVSGAAQWLHLAPKTIYSERSRKRADGTPRWPEPDETIGRSPLWSWRTLAWHAATMAQGFRNAGAQ